MLEPNLSTFLLKMQRDFEMVAVNLNRVNEAIVNLDKSDKISDICERIDLLLSKASYAGSLKVINNYYHELTGDYLSYDPKRRIVVVTESIRRVV